MKHLKMLGLAAVATMAMTAFAAVGTASATTIEVEGNAQNKAVAFTLSLKPGVASTWTTTGGLGVTSCSQSEWNGGTVFPFTEEFINANFAEYFFGGPCTETVKVLKAGELEIEWTAGTNAMVWSTGTELTINNKLLGDLICKTNVTPIGTIEGVAKGSATLKVNAVLGCGISLKWAATYLFTSPSGLGVVE